MIGAWASPAGADGAKGGSTVEVGAQGHALVRTNDSDSPKGRHDDTMLILAAPQGLRAVYADNEGHAIDYAVAADGKSATFLSAEGVGPRFRLTYAKQDDGAVAGTFELQPPGASDWKPFLSWKMRKR